MAGAAASTVFFLDEELVRPKVEFLWAMLKYQVEIRCLLYLLHEPIIDRSFTVRGTLEAEVRTDHPELISKCRQFTLDYYACLASIFIFTKTAEAYKRETEKLDKIVIYGQALINQLEEAFIAKQPKESRVNFLKKFREQFQAIWKYSFEGFKKDHPNYAPDFLDPKVNTISITSNKPLESTAALAI